MGTKITNSVDIDLDEGQAAGLVNADNDGTSVIDEDTVGIIDPALDPDIINEDEHPLDKLPPHAVLNKDGTVTLPLAYPKTLRTQKGGKIKETTYDSLTFHRLNGADTRAVSAASEESMSVVAFSRSTKITQVVMNALFDRMDAKDINDSAKVLNHFLNNGPKSGR
ncbi:hypothetical protein GGQ73_003180 [Rhizobium skierniewicense]|uniref:Phage tail assembly protein n=1 Tax=Rhizobium skierniewicense TaxID=984260 RepID=A0A7W6CA10_9HYPH|nr:phage tail assembly protein [Rhizobium skierniewicense]MBB3947214.1 hypothetical protein [Rhizobium skierniewicense]